MRLKATRVTAHKLGQVHLFHDAGRPEVRVMLELNMTKAHISSGRCARSKTSELPETGLPAGAHTRW